MMVESTSLTAAHFVHCLQFSCGIWSVWSGSQVSAPHLLHCWPQLPLPRRRAASLLAAELVIEATRMGGQRNSEAAFLRAEGCQCQPRTARPCGCAALGPVHTLGGNSAPGRRKPILGILGQVSACQGWSWRWRTLPRRCCWKLCSERSPGTRR